MEENAYLHCEPAEENSFILESDFLGDGYAVEGTVVDFPDYAQEGEVSDFISAYQFPSRSDSSTNGYEFADAENVGNSVDFDDQVLLDLDFIVRSPIQELEGVDENNWNELFQRIYNLPDSLEKYLALMNLVNNFVTTAHTYARVIISERSLADSEKTIAPSKGNIGIAGGDKYICAGIMFKFATDKKLAPNLWMYGNTARSEEIALKSVNHELKGITSFLNADVKELCFPLMAVIDFAGVRLVAIALLPINELSLRYGTCDGGKNIFNSDPTLQSLIERACTKLGLKEHQCGKKNVLLHGPADLEGHLGTDKRYYVLDFARLYPPEAPCSVKNSHPRCTFFNLLRPEFVRSYTTPLSPDGFSLFETGTKAVSKAELLEATERLHKHVIPKFASDLDQVFKNDTKSRKITAQNLIASIHKAGINVRHLGLLCKQCLTFKAKSLLITEMIARVVKGSINELFRELAKSFFSNDKMIQILIFHLNLLINNLQPKQKYFWETTLVYMLSSKFLYSIAPGSDSLFSYVSIYTLVKRLSYILGFRMRNKTKIQLKKGKIVEFTSVDIKCVEPKIKNLNIADYSEGAAYIYLAKSPASMASFSLKQLYLTKAVTALYKALHTAPFDAKSSYKLARCFHTFAVDEMNVVEFEENVRKAALSYKDALRFGFSSKKVISRVGSLYLMAASRTNAEKYYALAGANYQHVEKYSDCHSVLQELLSNALVKQGDALLSTLKLCFHCPLLREMIKTQLKEIKIGGLVQYSESELLKLLQVLEGIELLDISFMNVKDSFISIISASHPLKQINLRGLTLLTNNSLLSLQNCPHLISLTLDKLCLIGEAEFIKLSEHCTQLEYLSLNYCNSISEGGLASAVQNLSNLTYLSFVQKDPYYVVSDDVLPRLVVSTLKALHISSNKVTNAGLQRFAEELIKKNVHLDELSLIRHSRTLLYHNLIELPAPTDEGLLPVLSAITCATSLRLVEFGDIGDQSLSYIAANFPNLRELTLQLEDNFTISFDWIKLACWSNLEKFILIIADEDADAFQFLPTLVSKCPNIKSFASNICCTASDFLLISSAFAQLTQLQLGFSVRYLLLFLVSFPIFNIATQSQTIRPRIFDHHLKMCSFYWNHLTHLELREISISGELNAFRILSQHCTGLSTLKLHFVSATAKNIRAFFHQPKPLITKLDLSDCEKLDDETTNHFLPLLPNLKKLNLSQTSVSENIFPTLQIHQSLLITLKLSKISSISEGSVLSLLSHLKYLQKLVVSNNKLITEQFAFQIFTFLPTINLHMCHKNHFLPSALPHRMRIMMSLVASIEGKVKIETLERIADLFNVLQHFKPELLVDFTSFWEGLEKKIEKKEIANYLFILGKSRAILPMLRSYLTSLVDPNFNLRVLTVPKNYLVTHEALMLILEQMQQPITLKLSHCAGNTVNLNEIFTKFKFRSVKLKHFNFPDAICILAESSAACLQELILPNFRDLSTNALLSIAKHCPNLNILNIESLDIINSIIDDAGLEKVLQNCSQLISLNATGRNGFGGAFGKDFASECNLYECLLSSPLPADSLSKILSNSSNLEKMSCVASLCNLETFKKFTNLTSLQVNHSSVSKQFVEAIANCAALSAIGFTDCEFEDSSSLIPLFSSAELQFSEIHLLACNKPRSVSSEVFNAIGDHQQQVVKMSLGSSPAFFSLNLWNRLFSNANLRHFRICAPLFIHNFLLERLVDPAGACIKNLISFEDAKPTLADNTFPQFLENNKSLITLRIPNTQITNFQSLRNCPLLTNLDLSGNNITEEQLIYLSTVCPELKHLNLSQCLHVTDDAVIHIVKHCKLIAYLNLQKCKKVTIKAVSYCLEYGYSLSELIIYGCSVDGDAVGELQLNYKMRSLKYSSVHLAFTNIQFERAEEIEYQRNETNLFDALQNNLCTKLVKVPMEQEVFFCKKCETELCRSCAATFHSAKPEHELSFPVFKEFVCRFSRQTHN